MAHIEDITEHNGNDVSISDDTYLFYNTAVVEAEFLPEHLKYGPVNAQSK
jgi:hypothetical protein